MMIRSQKPLQPMPHIQLNDHVLAASLEVLHQLQGPQGGNSGRVARPAVLGLTATAVQVTGLAVPLSCYGIKQPQMPRVSGH